MRNLIDRSQHCLLIVGAALLLLIAAVTPGRAIGGGPISGGQIALSGGQDVSGGIRGPTPPSATPSASNPASHRHRRAVRAEPPR